MMTWYDRLTDPPDETVSWANPRHEILVWETQEDQPVFAVYVDAKWVNSYTTVLDELVPVTFRYWMPRPDRPVGIHPVDGWLRRIWEGTGEEQGYE